MIPKSHGSGSGLGGVMRYVTHDAPTADDRRPETSERVADAGTIELPPGISLTTAEKIMRATVREQKLLKELAGVSARGRPTVDPYHQLSLSWQRGYRPPRHEIETAVLGALKAIGLEGHQAIWVAHSDKEHFHVHIVVCRVSWENGRAVHLSHEKAKLSGWARKYEESQGEVLVETRVKREAWREEGRTLRAERAAASERGAEGEVRRLDRELAEHHQRWPKAEPNRGPGREARTDEEREEWARLFDAQRARPEMPNKQRAERATLAARHRRRRTLKRALNHVKTGGLAALSPLRRVAGGAADFVQRKLEARRAAADAAEHVERCLRDPEVADRMEFAGLDAWKAWKARGGFATPARSRARFDEICRQADFEWALRSDETTAERARNVQRWGRYVGVSVDDALGDTTDCFSGAPYSPERLTAAERHVAELCQDARAAANSGDAQWFAQGVERLTARREDEPDAPKFPSGWPSRPLDPWIPRLRRTEAPLLTPLPGTREPEAPPIPRATPEAGAVPEAVPEEPRPRGRPAADPAAGRRARAPAQRPGSLPEPHGEPQRPRSHSQSR